MADLERLVHVHIPYAAALYVVKAQILVSFSEKESDSNFVERSKLALYE